VLYIFLNNINIRTPIHKCQYFFINIFGEIAMVNNRLKEYREKAGLSQTELAWKSKMASQNISAIERGTLAPWPRAKRALAKALNIPETELFPEDSIDGQDPG
jgi:transcriptional regulator with XRE-family HTH domain